MQVGTADDNYDLDIEKFEQNFQLKDKLQK